MGLFNSISKSIKQSTELNQLMAEEILNTNEWVGRLEETLQSGSKKGDLPSMDSIPDNERMHVKLPIVITLEHSKMFHVRQMWTDWNRGTITGTARQIISMNKLKIDGPRYFPLQFAPDDKAVIHCIDPDNGNHTMTIDAIVMGRGKNNEARLIGRLAELDWDCFVKTVHPIVDEIVEDLPGYDAMVRKLDEEAK